MQILILNLSTVKRIDSIQSRRKVSSLSDRSDTSEQGVASGGEDDHGSPGILSDDQQPESPTDSNETDDTAKNMPWLKAVIELIGSYNFYCPHKGYCHPYCYKRHMRACSRLIKATRKVSNCVVYCTLGIHLEFVLLIKFLGQSSDVIAYCL